jgi:ribosomal-protein-alanine N-acetyltransferase
MYEEELRHAGTAFIIVLRGGGASVAGYCSYRLAADELQINNVPSDRNIEEGVRPGPVDTLATPGRPAPEPRSSTRRSNRPAQQLYFSVGFVQVGERLRYYSHPEEDALVLARDVQKVEGDPAA